MEINAGESIGEVDAVAAEGEGLGADLAGDPCRRRGAYERAVVGADGINGGAAGAFVKMVEINRAGDGWGGYGCGVAERGIANDVAGAYAIEVLRLRRDGGVVETCGVGAGDGDLGEVHIVG